jgi:hypothetical protein
MTGSKKAFVVPRALLALVVMFTSANTVITKQISIAPDQTTTYGMWKG